MVERSSAAFQYQLRYCENVERKAKKRCFVSRKIPLHPNVAYSHVESNSALWAFQFTRGWLKPCKLNDFFFNIQRRSIFVCRTQPKLDFSKAWVISGGGKIRRISLRSKLKFLLSFLLAVNCSEEKAFSPIFSEHRIKTTVVDR